MPEALLQINALSLSTAEGPIVSNLSFHVLPGEIVALTGKSGSGKTSVAMSILGLLSKAIHYVSGEIKWHGEDEDLTWPQDESQWAKLRGRHIAFIQQDVYGAFDPVISTGKQMLMVIRERASDLPQDVEKELRAKMEEVGLSDVDRVWHSYPHELSGGQLQRCQICMAIMIGPQILIADEPTSAIDKINQKEILDVLLNLRRKYNLAILCITHDLSVVKYLADREVVLNPGEMTWKERSEFIPMADTKNEHAILEVKEIFYAYRYSGIFNRKGSSIGPLDFKLFQGECLGVIGESGSGKSTLAQLLVGMLRPSSGKVLLDGSTIDFKKSRDISLLRSKVQLVMQDGRGSLHPNFTIGKIMGEVADQYAKLNPSYVINLNDSLAAVELPGNILERKPSSLSGGECLRVSIARALCLHPEVLICDESTSALDAATREGILEMLKELMQNRKLAVIFISHDEYAIKNLSNYLIVMAEGKIVERGPARELYQYPTHAATKKIFYADATSGK